MSIIDVFSLQLGSIRSFFWPQNSRLVAVVVVVVFSPFDRKVQSRHVPTPETHWRFHLITWYTTSGIREPGRRLVLLIHSRLLLGNFSAPVFELWGTQSICDKLTTWLILWFISKKLCSSLKTFGKTCKKPAATWLDIWAPLLSWVSRSLTLFLFSFS